MTINLQGHLDHRFYIKGRMEAEDQRDLTPSLSFFRGDTIGPIEVQVLDKHKAPVDITGYFLKMTVKRYDWDDLILYQVDSRVEEDAPFIFAYNAEQGVIHVKIPHTVTETFPPQTYTFDVQLYKLEDVDADPLVTTERRTVIRAGFSIKQDITTDGVITG